MIVSGTFPTVTEHVRVKWRKDVDKYQRYAFRCAFCKRRRRQERAPLHIHFGHNGGPGKTHDWGCCQICTGIQRRGSETSTVYFFCNGTCAADARRSKQWMREHYDIAKELLQMHIWRREYGPDVDTDKELVAMLKLRKAFWKRTRGLSAR